MKKALVVFGVVAVLFTWRTSRRQSTSLESSQYEYSPAATGMGWDSPSGT